MFNSSDIGWLKEVLDSVPGDVEEYDAPASIKPAGRNTILVVPPNEQEEGYLPDHDYFEHDDGQPVVEDDIDQITVTAAFFMEDRKISPKDPKFEFHFRAFLHNFEYSYNTQTVAETVKRLKETVC